MAQPPDTRARILAAARAAFVDGGGEIEMNDVAKRAGVSVGLAYHYFGSKSGLVSALIADFYDRYDAILNQRLDDFPSWPDREYRRVSESVTFVFEDPLAPILLGRLSGSAQVIAAEAERREAIIGLAVRNIQKAQESGEIDADIDPAFAAAAINGGLRQAAASALAAPDRWDKDAFLAQAWRFIEGALALPARREDGGAGPE